VAVGKSLRPLLDLAVLGLVLGGAVLVWNMASSNRELVAKLQLTTPLVERANVRDRLVGTSISLPSFDLERPDAILGTGNAEAGRATRRWRCAASRKSWFDSWW